MSPWLKPAQQSPTPHYPDPTFLHIGRDALISPQIYGWLLITSLTTAPSVDKFEGQPALGYTAKEQGEEAKAKERARGIGSQMKEERETCRSLTEHHSVEADISLHCLPVMSEFKPFVLRSLPSCGLRGYGDRVCQRVYESYQCWIETCQGPAPDHVT